MKEVTNVEKLKNIIIETMDGGLTSIKEETEKLTEEMALVREDCKTNRDAVESIKNIPATVMNLHSTSGKTKGIYNGFQLENQGNNSELLRVDSFKLMDESKKESISKMLIDMINSGFKGQREFMADAGPMTGGTDGSGGYLVFDEYMNVIRSLGELYGVCLSECEVVPMSSDTLHYPVDNDANLTVAEKTETTAHGDAIPDNIVTEISLTCKDLGGYAILTNQLIQDSKFDIIGFLTPKFAAAISRLIDYNVFTPSASSNAFDPLVDDASIQDSTGVLDIAHILSAYGKLDRRMKANAKFFFNRLVYYGTVLSATDTNGRPIFTNPAAQMMESLWKIPVVDTEDLPSTLVEGDMVGLIGDLRQAYVIGQRSGVGSFLINPYTYDSERMTKITLNTRWAGKPGFAKSMVKLIY